MRRKSALFLNKPPLCPALIERGPKDWLEMDLFELPLSTDFHKVVLIRRGAPHSLRLPTISQSHSTGFQQIPLTDRSISLDLNDGIHYIVQRKRQRLLLYV